MKEIFKDIEGYERYYKINNFGDVFSIRNNIFLKQQLNHGGYSYYILQKKGKIKNYLISRLVAKTFIPNPENKPQCNHKNGIKTDNKVENLEWVTPSENTKHAHEIGLINQKGEKNNGAKLTWKQVNKIRKLKGKLFQREIAKLFNISQGTINDILNNRTWVVQ